MIPSAGKIGGLGGSGGGGSGGVILQSLYKGTAADDSTSTGFSPINLTPTTSDGKRITALESMITPTKIGNKIRVTVLLYLNVFSAGKERVAAIFKNAETNATKAAASGPVADTNGMSQVQLVHEETVSSLAEQTWNVHFGTEDDVSTCYLNRNDLISSFFNGLNADSYMILEEINV